MSKKERDERARAREILRNTYGLNPSLADRNLIHVDEILLDQISYLVSEIITLRVQVERLQAVIDFHNLNR